MTLLIIAGALAATVFIEALIFAPEKMPWNRRKQK